MPAIWQIDFILTVRVNTDDVKCRKNKDALIALLAETSPQKIYFPACDHTYTLMPNSSRPMTMRDFHCSLYKSLLQPISGSLYASGEKSCALTQVKDKDLQNLVSHQLLWLSSDINPWLITSKVLIVTQHHTNVSLERNFTNKQYPMKSRHSFQSSSVTCCLLLDNLQLL